MAFRAGLCELGYLEGKNFTIDFRWAEERSERLPALATELEFLINLKTAKQIGLMIPPNVLVSADRVIQ